MKRLWIVGGSGAALEAAAVAAAEGREVAGYVVPAGERTGFDPRGAAVRAEPEFLAEADAELDEVVLALGAPGVRARAAAAYAERGLGFATLVHPRAVLGPRVELGGGSIVMAGAVLETDVRTGAHALINVQASLAHECVLGACCSIGPGVHLAGRVQLGDRCDVGVGAALRPGVRLGSDVVVGAGAAVVGDFAGPGVLLGVPARPRA